MQLMEHSMASVVADTKVRSRSDARFPSRYRSPRERAVYYTAPEGMSAKPTHVCTAGAERWSSTESCHDWQRMTPGKHAFLDISYPYKCFWISITCFHLSLSFSLCLLVVVDYTHWSFPRFNFLIKFVALSQRSRKGNIKIAYELGTVYLHDHHIYKLLQKHYCWRLVADSILHLVV